MKRHCYKGECEAPAEYILMRIGTPDEPIWSACFEHYTANSAGALIGAGSHYWIRLPSIADAENNLCSCSLQELMRLGCKCGGE